ncbi:hypothetical protein [Chryseobacterium jejuense]|uniref:hypothetical protein n=1 Tax=Chryseobacterium jejuense TaxID=445960 RepID=UPI001AEB7752|nr:hypothetical protein [Chryseobacterium jejuense]MBP2619200.1 hypothetical protein [Chryseobacterium jejuense]
MKKLIILAASTAIAFSVSSCSDRDENVTPQESAMKIGANLNKQGIKVNSTKTESSTSKITPPIQGDNPDETIDPTKPDRPR